MKTLNRSLVLGLQCATAVDSGIGEVIRKQGDGYPYVKVGG